MLGEFTAKCPSGVKRNKVLEAEAEVAHGVTESGRVSSSVNVYNTEYLKEIRKLDSAHRSEFESMTKQWSARGRRLIPFDMIKEAKARYATYVIARSKAEQAFYNNHEAHKNRDRQVLGTLFDGSAYPSVDELKSKFATELVFTTVPDAEQDVRAGWTDAMKAEYAAATLETEAKRVKSIREEMDKTARDYIERMAERMRAYTKDSKNFFQDSITANVKGAVEMYEMFNFDNDPETTKWCSDVISSLCVTTPKELRESPELREEVAKAADGLVSRMGSFGMAAPGQD
jgi:hypothetical protein